MADRDSGSSVLSWPMLIVLLLFGWGILSERPRPQSARPPTPTTRPDSPDAQDIPARLWQDPVEAVRSELSRRSHGAGREDGADALDPVTKLDGLRNDLRNGPTGPGSLLVMGVHIPGQPYDEPVENRRRTRAAVIYALGAVGYVPAHYGEIGCIRWRETPPADARSPLLTLLRLGSPRPVAPPPAAGDRFVPFEVFKPERFVNAAKTDCVARVLVLWLDDEHFRTDLLATVRGIAQIARTGTDPRKEPASSPRDLIRTTACLVGPTSSNNLLHLVNEYLAIKPVGPWGDPIDFFVYSPLATMSHAQLLDLREKRENLPDQTTARKAEQFLAGHEPLARFESTIGNDRELIDLIIDELHLRRACPRDPTKHIVIISNWDTYYGRSWYSGFSTAVADRPAARGFRFCDHERHRAYPHIHHYAYFEGVDGRLPAAGRTDDATDSDPDLPEGTAQVDGLRRLQRTLTELRSSIEREGRGELAAIGVLGNDVYDKLLILQTLRAQFPRTKFFTTDLDARMLQPEHYGYTRNVLIASHYGLETDGFLQRLAPPFRDSYRASIYIACLKALRFSRLDRYEVPPRARIYEVARGYAYDLTGTAGRAESAARDINPPGPRSHYWFVDRQRRWLLVFTVLLAVVLLTPLSKALQSELKILRRFDSRAGWRLFAYALTALLVYWLFDTVRRDHHSAAGEPFAPFDGISVWPTTLLRALAIGLAILFIRTIWLRLAANREALTESFGLPGPPDLNAAGPKRSWLNRRLYNILQSQSMLADLRRLGERVWVYWRKSWMLDWNVTSSQPHINEVWSEYCDLGRPGRRGIRALVMGSVFVLFVLTLFGLFNWPADPSRGPTSYGVAKAILISSIIGVVLLTSIVLDATLLCDHLLAVLRGRRIVWKKRTTAPDDIAPADVDSEIRKIRLVAEHTRVVDRFIYYPFVVLFIMFAARHRAFDEWDFPLGLVLVFVMMMLTIVLSAWFLRRGAEAVRQESLDYLREVVYAAKASVARGGKAAAAGRVRADLAEQAMTVIREQREGAFSTLGNTPVLRAVLIPFGGAGTLSMLEMLSPYLRAAG